MLLLCVLHRCPYPLGATTLRISKTDEFQNRIASFTRIYFRDDKLVWCQCCVQNRGDDQRLRCIGIQISKSNALQILTIIAFADHHHEILNLNNSLLRKDMFFHPATREHQRPLGKTVHMASPGFGKFFTSTFGQPVHYAHRIRQNGYDWTVEFCFDLSDHGTVNKSNRRHEAEVEHGMNRTQPRHAYEQWRCRGGILHISLHEAPLYCIQLYRLLYRCLFTTVLPHLSLTTHHHHVCFPRLF